MIFGSTLEETAFHARSLPLDIALIQHSQCLWWTMAQAHWVSCLVEFVQPDHNQCDKNDNTIQLTLKYMIGVPNNHE